MINRYIDKKEKYLMINEIITREIETREIVTIASDISF
jgi:hypothetical protein